jgi:hypothetical protein
VVVRQAGRSSHLTSSGVKVPRARTWRTPHPETALNCDPA